MSEIIHTKNKTSLGQETAQEQEASDESRNPFTVCCPPGIRRADITFNNTHIDFIKVKSVLQICQQ